MYIHTYICILTIQESGPICNCPYLNLPWARRASPGDYSVKALPRRNTKTSWLTVIVTTFREGLTDTFTYERHRSLSYIDCLWRSDFFPPRPITLFNFTKQPSSVRSCYELLLLPEITSELALAEARLCVGYIPCIVEYCWKLGAFRAMSVAFIRKRLCSF